MWEMPWTESATLTDARIAEELLKRGQGELKVKLSLPINWIDEFDIFSNFRLQDPFGVVADGSGEYGRYYYIESITVDFMNQRIDIVGIDLQYILRRCIILGDCASIPDDWANASEEQRLYGYLCDCTAGEFSDGGRCKILCPC